MTNIHGIGSGHVQGGNVVTKADVSTVLQSGQNDATRKAAVQDGTTLSHAGSLLASSATTVHDVRTDKVESLRAAINNGTYSVSSRDVAETLLKSMLG